MLAGSLLKWSPLTINTKIGPFGADVILTSLKKNHNFNFITDFDYVGFDTNGTNQIFRICTHLVVWRTYLKILAAALNFSRIISIVAFWNVFGLVENILNGVWWLQLGRLRCHWHWSTIRDHISFTSLNSNFVNILWVRKWVSQTQTYVVWRIHFATFLGTFDAIISRSVSSWRNSMSPASIKILCFYHRKSFGIIMRISFFQEVDDSGNESQVARESNWQLKYVLHINIASWILNYLRSPNV